VSLDLHTQPPKLVNPRMNRVRRVEGELGMPGRITQKGIGSRSHPHSLTSPTHPPTPLLEVTYRFIAPHPGISILTPNSNPILTPNYTNPKYLLLGVQ
jgi:hypothetical protein